MVRDVTKKRMVVCLSSLSNWGSFFHKSFALSAHAFWDKSLAHIGLWTLYAMMCCKSSLHGQSCACHTCCTMRPTFILSSVSRLYRVLVTTTVFSTASVRCSVAFLSSLPRTGVTFESSRRNRSLSENFEGLLQ